MLEMLRRQTDVELMQGWTRALAGHVLQKHPDWLILGARAITALLFWSTEPLLVKVRMLLVSTIPCPWQGWDCSLMAVASWGRRGNGKEAPKSFGAGQAALPAEMGRAGAKTGMDSPPSIIAGWVRSKTKQKISPSRILQELCRSVLPRFTPNQPRKSLLTHKVWVTQLLPEASPTQLPEPHHQVP